MKKEDSLSSLLVKIVALLTLLAQGWVIRVQSKSDAETAFRDQQREERFLNVNAQFGEVLTKLLSECECGGGE